MKVTVRQASSGSFNLKLPTGLVLNRPAAWVLARQLRKKNVHIGAKDLYRFMKAARTCKMDHPDWLLVEMCSADGEEISVTL